MKSRKTSMFISSLAVVLLLATILSVCSFAESTPEEPITITFFGSRYKWEGPICEEVTRQTGVILEPMERTTDPQQKIGLMLASDDLPDIIGIGYGSVHFNSYITSNAVIDLTDLIEEYAPNIKEEYAYALQRKRFTDGRNYFIPAGVGMPIEPSSGMVMRQDLLEEVVGQRALDGDSFTTTEFLNILETVIANHPTLEGQPTILISPQPDALISIFEGFWGMKVFHEEGDNLYYKWRHPRYEEMLLYINDLYRRGWFDPDWPSSLYEGWQGIMSQGNVFASTTAFFEVGGPDAALELIYGKGTKAQYRLYQIYPEHLTKDDVRTDGRNTLGWDGMFITKANKYPVETMKFLDFLGSKDGLYLTQWGVEGIHYTVADDGHFIANGDILTEFGQDWVAAATKWGMFNWCMIPNFDNVDIRGPLNVFSTDLDVDVRLAFAVKSSLQTKYATDFYEGLNPTQDDFEVVNLQQVADVMKIAYPQIVSASSPEECSALYQKMVADCEAAGAAAVESVINRKAEERRVEWGLK